MSKKVIILVEDDLSKVEDMLLSIQSILYVATKQELSNAPFEGDTEIFLLHVPDNLDKEGFKIFGKFKSALEDQQRKYEFELEYKYEAVHIDKNLYAKNINECTKKLSDKIEEITQEREYSIVLDLILVRDESKDVNQILKGEKNLSQLLYEKFREHCIPYTTYDHDSQTFRVKWAEMVGCEKVYERRCLDGNVIHKEFKKTLCEQLKIGEGEI